MKNRKSYKYGWLDKVMNITQNGKVSNSYTYSINGQIASADISGKQESFLWDGLALLKRGSTEYVYEPAVTGGNPILANGKAMFNDMLGNTLGVTGEKDKFTSIKRDAFGKTLENPAGNAYNMFTGKPQIGGLGYAFLFRNYRPNLGKWQTADPLGYPDGLNNFAYGNNAVTSGVDYQGTGWVLQPGSALPAGGAVDGPGGGTIYAIRDHDGHNCDLNYSVSTLTTTTYTRGSQANVYTGDWEGSTFSDGDVRTVKWAYNKRVTEQSHETGRWACGENYDWIGPVTSDSTTTYWRTFTYKYVE